MTTTYDNYNASKSSCADTSWITASKLPEQKKLFKTHTQEEDLLVS